MKRRKILSDGDSTIKGTESQVVKRRKVLMSQDVDIDDDDTNSSVSDLSEKSCRVDLPNMKSIRGASEDKLVPVEVNNYHSLFVFCLVQVSPVNKQQQNFILGYKRNKSGNVKINEMVQKENQ